MSALSPGICMYGVHTGDAANVLTDYGKAPDYGGGRPYMGPPKPWPAPTAAAPGFGYGRAPAGYSPMQPYGPMYVQPHPVMGQGKTTLVTTVKLQCAYKFVVEISVDSRLHVAHVYM